MIAQLLDYGSWVAALSADDIEEIYSSRTSNGKNLADAFRDRFGTDLPETLNESHRLIVVAAELDAGSERIVDYLSTNYGVPINALFFRYFKDGSAEYIARSWLLDPVEVEGRTKWGTKRTQETWNGHDFYISFGEDEARTLEDARQYGFVSGGGGRRYSGPLNLLERGHRVFVNVPGKGYVGVGVVTESSQPVKDFIVDVDGTKKPILDAPIRAERMDRQVDDPDLSEYLVRVRWIKTLPVEKAYRETGFFGNQNIACRFRHRPTLEMLYRRFGVSEDPDEDATAVILEPTSVEEEAAAL
ncbi:MAG: DUF91 domain-containing protein [Actinobacteria bacterium]|nr:DUF91 domain-containing protein [Actinomycetota bacterium]